MSTKKKSLAGRILASVGAAALGVVGVAGLATTAMAEDVPAPDPTPNFGNIDPDAKGSLTINKLVGDEKTGKGTPVDGVTFTIQKCESFDATYPEAWESIKDWDAATSCAKLGAAQSEKTANGGQAVFKNLAVGAYWVVEDQDSLPAGVSGSISFWVTIPYPAVPGKYPVAPGADPSTADGWIYDVVVYPKNSIKGDGSKTADKVTGLEVGSTVDWTLTSPVLGSEMLPGGSTSFEVTDTYGEYQTYVDKSATLSVQVPGADPVPFTAYLKVANDTNANKVTFTYDWSSVEPTWPAGTKFIIEYQTEVKGLPENGEIKNDTPWGWDATYWGSFTAKKVSTTGQNLEGAEFALYEGACPAEPAEGEPAQSGPAEGLKFVKTLTSGADGKIESGQLYVAKGTANAEAKKDYCLVETKAPAGFVLGDPAYSQTINLGAGENSVTLADIENTPATGPKLPVTGASGTVLMTVGGIALIAIAGGLYLSTRRKAIQE